ncbi:MAG TPA: MBL fold metallo-hydrolase [Patescibacteria group bacterium]|nr:MBL fold metallo-hydrolase [Patescibacteria group bacterium]
MQISWYGLSCFRIQTKDAAIVIDPFDPSVGIKLPVPSKFTADLVISSKDSPAHRHIDGVGGSPFVITTPGEYEVKNTFVYGFPIPAGKGEGSIFRIEAEDLVIAHLGALTKPLENGEIEVLEEADILLVSVGGNGNLTYDSAVTLISEIEPRIVIPHSYHIKGLKAKADPIEKFLKEFGVKTPETTDRYKISRKDLPADEVKVILLNQLS